MRVYLDTSVILPRLVRAHPRHEEAVHLFQSHFSGDTQFVISTHSIAELYANISRFPIGNRISPQTTQEILDRFFELCKEVVELSFQDYESATDNCVENNLTSGVIYDALHLQAARKSGCNSLYTANYKDFIRLSRVEDFVEVVNF